MSMTKDDETTAVCALIDNYLASIPDSEKPARVMQFIDAMMEQYKIPKTVDVKFYTTCKNGGDGSASAELFSNKEIAEKWEESEQDGEYWGDSSLSEKTLKIERLTGKIIVPEFNKWGYRNIDNFGFEE